MEDKIERARHEAQIGGNGHEEDLGEGKGLACVTILPLLPLHPDERIQNFNALHPFKAPPKNALSRLGILLTSSSRIGGWRFETTSCQNRGKGSLPSMFPWRLCTRGKPPRPHSCRGLASFTSTNKRVAVSQQNTKTEKPGPQEPSLSAAPAARARLCSLQGP